MASTTTPALRSPGPLERFFIARNSVNFYNHVSIAALYHLPTASPSLKPLIYSALRNVLKSHAALNITLQNSSTTPTFTRLDDIDFRQNVKFVEHPASTIAAFDVWIQAEHHISSFDDREGKERPLWRIVIVHPPASANEANGTTTFGLAFIFHHAIADGISGTIFHTSFLSALNDVLRHSPIVVPAIDAIDDVAIFHPSPTLTLPPALADRVKMSLTWIYTLKNIFSAFLHSPRPDALSWAGPPIAQPTNPNSTIRVSSFFVPGDQLKILLRKCKNQNTTLTALLLTLIARYLPWAHTTHTRFTGAVPFSLRKFFPSDASIAQEAANMGVYISSLPLQFSADLPKHVPSKAIPLLSRHKAEEQGGEEEMWIVARATCLAIKAGTLSAKDQSVGLLKYVSDMPKFFTDKLGKEREAAFEVSNLGVVDGGIPSTSTSTSSSKETKAYFDRMQCSTGYNALAYPYMVYVVSVKGGGMCVTLNWQTDVVGEGEVEGVLAALRGGLEKLAE